MTSVGAGAFASTLMCNSLLESGINLTKNSKYVRHIDIGEVTAIPVSVEQLDQIVSQLRQEKLIWFSVEDFAKDKIQNWEPGDTLKNYLTYTVSVFVKKAQGQYVQVNLPIISYKDVQNDGFPSHVHLWKHLKKKYFPAGQSDYVEVGTVIIEKQDNAFLVENNNRCDHVGRCDTAEILNANRRKSIFIKTP